ncbi:cysteine proteinase [Xylariaceae sp. FL0594]|nr:cysteine proteinase [Xylariaceae sp. FL0594]
MNSFNYRSCHQHLRSSIRQMDLTTPPSKPDEVPTTANTARRSGRATKPRRMYDAEDIVPAHAMKQQTQESPTRPKAKRKAAEAALGNIGPEDTAALQDQVLARMDIDERKEYRGWVQLESEPAFFNAMLQDLHAKDFKMQEVFGLDETMLADLPKPVHGLLFLYEWGNEDDSPRARQECPSHLWFGNQTTANACATVALMNIIMNARGVRLGPELERFRDTTKGLSPPHRGHALNTHDFIRAIHNSVARRNDLLSEDLLLQNKYEDSFHKKKPTKRKRVASKPSKKEDRESSTYHYIAFVPLDGQVWELDGLEAKPLCLGEYKTTEPDSWLTLARNAIQERMARRDDADAYLSFNLLAACQSPLVSISRQLATSLATYAALKDAVRSRTNPPPQGNHATQYEHAHAHALTHALASSSPWDSKYTDSYLSSRFGLTRSAIISDFPPRADILASLSALLPSPSPVDSAPAPTTCTPTSSDMGKNPLVSLAEGLRAEQDDLDARYAAEAAAVDEAVEMIRRRQRDYTPAIHAWVRILAEKGVLRELIQEMDLFASAAAPVS